MVSTDWSDLAEETWASISRRSRSVRSRRVDQARLLEIRHHVADRGRRQVHRQGAAECPRTDGITGLDIALDDLPENLARPEIEFCQS